MLLACALAVSKPAGIHAAQRSPSRQTGSASGTMAKSSGDSKASSSRNVLRFGVHVSAMGKLDPHFAAGSQDRAFADMVFNGLLRYEPGNAPHIEPDLAERIPEFKMVGGKQVWTFKLRKGVMFHPGPDTAAYEMTADDVVYSLQKSANKNLSAYAGEYIGMTARKTDSYTVEILLDKPLSPILFLPKLANYAGGFIVSKKAVETMGYERFKAHPIGTGPFRVKRHLPGRKLILEPHDQYFRGRPLLDGVEFHFYPGTGEREAAFLDGKVDVITASGDKGWMEKMERMGDIAIDTHGVGEMVTLFFNTRMAPMDDIRVRKAVAFALNRNAFLATTSKRITGPAFSPVPAKFLPGGLEKKDARHLGISYPTDVEKAKKLLAEAGHPHGFSLELVTSEKRLYLACYEVLREQLAKVGIKCKIKRLTHSDMHRQIRHAPKSMVIYIAWRPNADVYLTRFFHSDSIIVEGARPDTNFSFYDKIDKMIEDARLQIDPDKQVRLWMQAQICILNDMAAFPVMYVQQAYVRRPYVDYGHRLVSTMALYPQFTEKTRILDKP
jgi:peptide/nickel transport system substrate-binding protein